jgi:hypothetical protein
MFRFQFVSGKPVLGQLVDDYLLDFDIFHVSHVTELTHYIDTKECQTKWPPRKPAEGGFQCSKFN